MVVKRSDDYDIWCRCCLNQGSHVPTGMRHIGSSLGSIRGLAIIRQRLSSHTPNRQLSNRTSSPASAGSMQFTAVAYRLRARPSDRRRHPAAFMAQDPWPRNRSAPSSAGTAASSCSSLVRGVRPPGLCMDKVGSSSSPSSPSSPPWARR